MSIDTETARRVAKLARIRAQVSDDDDLMLITNGGMVIRTSVKGISVLGRDTQGVRLIELKESEKVGGVARLVERDSDEEPST